ncbi:MAG TPA: hypothetical protein VFL34_08550 [Candidatus Sulfotelmatobacter sp.]|nr:hypothetical protein [Candidatus Sulfotelmatobacter sp.]
MRTYLSAALLSGALLCAASFAQSAAPATQSPAQPQTTQSQAAQPSASAANSANSQTPRIAPGSVIPVQLTKTIDAKKAKAGDQIVAKVTMDLKTSSGEVLVPKDTKVTGHVTEAQARNKDQKESQLGIAFDRASLKSGDMPLPMSIQAVIAPPSNNANGGSDEGAPAPSGGSAAPTPSGSSRNGSMGSGQTSPSSTAPSTNNEGTEGPQQQNGARPPITGNTQGVVGISNLTLQPGANAAQGSVLTSEKNNVKVESGTMLLLKVNP